MKVGDIMNKIMDKLGVYDLVAVLLSGISILTFSLWVSEMVYDISIDLNLQVNETLSFIVLSYFLGLVFQELGSLMQKKVFHKNNGLLKAVFKTSANSHIFLTEVEKSGVYSYVIEHLNLDPSQNNDNEVYNYCKFFIIERGDTARIDKEQSLSAMSRSLSLYFLLLVAVTSIHCLFHPSSMELGLIIISLILGILLYYRCVRFAKLRYTYIFRTFYYSVVAKTSL